MRETVTLLHCTAVVRLIFRNSWGTSTIMVEVLICFPQNLSTTINRTSNRLLKYWWIGCWWQMVWPPTSPKLTPMVFCPGLHVASSLCRGYFCPCCWGRSNNQVTGEFLNARFSLYCCIVDCASRSVGVHLNICSKLERNTTFFRLPQVNLLDF